jgi:hypothetical protein
MLYIIGGVSRSGKSIIARRLLSDSEISYFSLDILMMGFANGFPQFGIHPEDSSRIISNRLWPIVKSMAVNIIETSLDYTLEGDSIMPWQVAELKNKYSTDIRACFLGYSNINCENKMIDIRQSKGLPNDWINEWSDDRILDYINRMKISSRELEQQCKQLGLKYFDGSNGFEEMGNQAISYLKYR